MHSIIVQLDTALTKEAPEVPQIKSGQVTFPEKQLVQVLSENSWQLFNNTQLSAGLSL